MDPPHVVDTGGACSFCFGLAQSADALQRCSSCKRAWYHNRNCQADHFKEHKSFCKTMSLVDKLYANLPKSARPSTAEEFYVQRITARSAMQPFMRRPLTMREARAIICEAKCSICMRTRGELSATGQKLLCCPDCNWGWACTTHAAQYHTKDKHGVACGQYKLMNDAQLTMASLLRESGRMPSYLPDTLRQEPYRIPEDGWSLYEKLRPLEPPLDRTSLAIVSKRLSQVLTVMLALQKFYSIEELGSMDDITVHIIGAGLYEVPADAVWEELFHLLPSLQRLHVAFIGPEVGDIIKEEDDMMEFDMTCCQDCSKLGKQRRYSYGMHPYHVYLQLKQAGGKASPPKPPTIAAAFNSGIYEEDRELWKPSLKALAAAGTPCVFTSYNEAESKGDEAAWKAAGGSVLQGPQKNPYRSLEPIMEPSAIDTFYFHNYWFSLFGSRPEKDATTNQPSLEEALKKVDIAC